MLSTDDTVRTLDRALDGRGIASVTVAGAPGLQTQVLPLDDQQGSVLRFPVGAGSDWFRTVGTDEWPVQMRFEDALDGTGLALQGTARLTHGTLECVVEAGAWWDGTDAGRGMPVAIVRSDDALANQRFDIAA